jgi:hypothetical protein
MITQELLHQRFTYSLDTGLFFYKEPPHPRLSTKKAVGTKSRGYLKVEMEGKSYALHRLAFLYVVGYMPKEVDHIDGNRANNTWKNLREVTRSQNVQNSKIRSDNKLGIKGVYKSSGSYKACIYKLGKRYARTFNLSDYVTEVDCLEAAKKWVSETRENIHLEFANHG